MSSLVLQDQQASADSQQVFLSMVIQPLHQSGNLEAEPDLLGFAHQECVHSGLIGNNGVLEGLLQLVGGLTGTPAQTCAWSQNAQREFKGELEPCSSLGIRLWGLFRLVQMLSGAKVRSAANGGNPDGNVCSDKCMVSDRENGVQWWPVDLCFRWI
jgi:hypothetical protein